MGVRLYSYEINLNSAVIPACPESDSGKIYCQIHDVSAVQRIA